MVRKGWETWGAEREGKERRMCRQVGGGGRVDRRLFWGN